MTSIFNKLKSLGIGIIVLTFFMGVALSSCDSSKKSESKDNVEEAAKGEHPTDSEHPSDSTKSEHPTDKEHPAK